MAEYTLYVDEAGDFEVGTSARAVVGFAVPSDKA